MSEMYERWMEEIDWNEPKVSTEDLELADLFSEILHRRDEYDEIKDLASIRDRTLSTWSSTI